MLRVDPWLSVIITLHLGGGYLPLRAAKIAVILSLALATSIILVGCGAGIDAGQETNGKPALVYFWEPG